MPKFKVGDKVRVVQPEGVEYTSKAVDKERRFMLSAPPGWTSTIKVYNTRSEPAWQLWGVPEWFYSDELELVPREKGGD